MKLTLALACAAFLAAPFARAADAAAARPALAVEITRLVMPEETWNRSMQALVEQMKQLTLSTAQSAGGALPAELVSQNVEDAMRIIPYTEMVDVAAGVYAKHYSEADLKELLAFYRTPIGQKSIRLMPEIMQDVNGQVMAIMQQRMPALMEKVKARAERYAADTAAAQQAAPAATEAQPAAKPAQKRAPSKKPAAK